MLKKILAVTLSILMLGSSATVLASAEEAKQKTFNYVAMGDSIASGYGLEGSNNETGLDRALILNEDLIANPIQDAYANVFGGYLADLGSEMGYTTTTANIASTAYRAEDVEATIYTPGYKGEVATFIFETFVGEGSSAVLLQYHDIYNKYLPDADLVSIGLGGNDVIMGVIYPMLATDNQILKTVALSLALVLFGKEPTYAVGAGLKLIEQHKDEITVDDVKEAVSYLRNIMKDPNVYVYNAAENVRGVVNAVKDVNSDADIALVGMFNPYGTSLEYDGQIRDVCNVCVNILAQAIAEAVDVEIEVGDVEITPSGESGEKELTFDYKEHTVGSDYFKEMRKERAKALLDIVAKELSYPLQYLLVGKNIDSQIKLLNELLAQIAEEEGCAFVDVYGISNENNLDPHPTKEGHKEIADLLWGHLAQGITDKMLASEETDVIIGDIDGDGQVTVADATQLQKYLAGMATDEGFNIAAADVDGDGEITVADVTMIQRIAAGLPTA